MAGEKLQQMKSAAKQIVDRLGPQDWLSVVVFDDTAEEIVPAGAVQNPAALKARIDAVQERGGTHMSTGMQLGLAELQRGAASSRVSSFILLTDGQTWEDTAECESLADQFRAAGIPIQAFGLGVGAQSNWDPALLENLAGRSGGDWAPLETPDQVAAAFSQTLLSVQGAAVTNAQLTLRMVAGASARTVWRVSPLIARLGHQAISSHDVQVFLGDISQSAGQAVLADLLLPPRKPGVYRLLQVDVVYDDPVTGQTAQKVAADVIVTITDDASLASQLNPRLMNLVERVVAHKLQTQALDEAAQGNRAAATQRLRAAATRLLELGETGLAQQAEQQAEQLERSGQIDPGEAQKMRYATRKLTGTL
jgi:Ca-activated chloride channel family protein